MMKRIFILFLALPLMFGACKKDPKLIAELVKPLPNEIYLSKSGQKYSSDWVEVEFKNIDIDNIDVITNVVNGKVIYFIDSKILNVALLLKNKYDDNGVAIKKTCYFSIWSTKDKLEPIEEVHYKGIIKTLDNKQYTFEHKFKINITQ